MPNDSASLYLQQARAAQRGGDILGSIEKLKSVLQITPSHLGARLDLSWKLLQTHRLDDAEAVSESILVDHPDSPFGKGGRTGLTGAARPW